MRVGVYGLGRFGTFWAQFLTDVLKTPVSAYSRSGPRDLPPGVVFSSESEVLSSDAVFFCVAISSFEEVLARCAPLIGPHTLVADTCSVKVHPVKVMERVLRGPILATHPMFGPDSAMNGVSGLPLVAWPVRVDDAAYRTWLGVFRGAGLSVREMSPDDHDREAARTQGITHLVGRILGRLDLAASDIGTMGYRRILQVVEQTCNDPYQLFLDLQTFNPHTKQVRESLMRAVAEVCRDLDSASNSIENGTARKRASIDKPIG